MMPGRRKKWTEVEERSLIDKYGQMFSDGTLSKMKTREKKFKPIALYVNSVHHVRDPIAYPWQWSWKDVSTKVQNMRHQYSLVKQKVKKPPPEPGSGAAEGEEDFDWVEGLSHWSNFLRYKEVFGDFGGGGGDPVAGFGVGGGGGGPGLGLDLAEFEEMGGAGDGGFGAGIDGIDNGVMGLGFGDDDGFVYEEVGPSGVSDSNKKKKKRSSKKVLKGLCAGEKKRRTWGILGRQMKRLREMEARFEQREAESERERQRREERQRERDEREKAREKRVREWDASEKEGEERERRRREEESVLEREWEERMSRRRAEWKESMDETLSRHREEMDQIQNRIIHDQQSLTNQLLGIVGQWTTHPAALSDHTSASNHYFSQMMQNLHQNSLVHDDTRVEGDNQDDQFIVDG